MTAVFARGLAASLAALFLAAAPAQAADVAQIGCPVDSLSAPERSNLAEHVRRQGNAEEPAMRAFFGSVSQCASRNHWSLDAARQAIAYNLSVVGAREARAQLESRGIDVAAIERALLADRPTISAVTSVDDPRDAVTAFYERLDPGLRASLEGGEQAGDNAEQLGTFVVFRAMIETSRTAFAAQ